MPLGPRLFRGKSPSPSNRFPEPLVANLEQRDESDPNLIFRCPIPWRGWLVIFRFGRVERRLECLGLEILQDPKAPEPTTITRGRIGAIPIRRFIGEAIDAYWKLSGATRPEKEPPPEAGHPRGRRGPTGVLPKLGEYHFQHVAETYARAWEEGLNPTQTVADRWGVSHTAAANWVARAREMGLLPPTRPGRARGPGDESE